MGALVYGVFVFFIDSMSGFLSNFTGMFSVLPGIFFGGMFFETVLESGNISEETTWFQKHHSKAALGGNNI